MRVIPRSFNLNRILVPLDFSPLSKKALHYATRFAREFDAELVLFHVLDPDEIEGPRDHALRGEGEREPEGLLLALEHAMLVVEAVEVVGDADRVGREGVRPAALGRLGDVERRGRVGRGPGSGRPSTATPWRATTCRPRPRASSP